MAQINRSHRSKRRGSAVRALTPAKPVEVKKISVGDNLAQVRDSYNNLTAKLGNEQMNPMSTGYYVKSGLTSDWQQLTIMYRESWLTKKIIDMPAEDMTKGWITLDTQLAQEGIDRVEKEMRQYRVQKKFTEAVRWARLYGGTIMIILIDGQEDMMHEPLDLTMVMPGSFRGLIVKDRWNDVEPSSDLVLDMQDPDYGLPEFYSVGELGIEGEDGIGNGQIKVHHSRVIRMIGRELPSAEEESEMYWGASEMEHIMDELEKRDATSSNISQLVFQANLRVLKMSDLGQMLSMSDERTQRELFQTIQAQNTLMTSFGLQVLDQSDSFETHPYAFQGLNDIYQSFQGDIAGAAEIPATKLFGKSPDGMNSTGEGDMLNYYDSIRQKQENMLRPGLEKIVPILCVSALGKVPDDIEVVFEPVESATESQRAALATQITGAIGTLYQSDLISKSMALKELRDSAFATGIGSAITDKDIEKAMEEDQLAAEQARMEPMMPGMPQGGAEQPQGGQQMPGMGNQPPVSTEVAEPNIIPKSPEQDAQDRADTYFTDAVENIRQKIGRIEVKKAQIFRQL